MIKHILPQLFMLSVLKGTKCLPAKCKHLILKYIYSLTDIADTEGNFYKTHRNEKLQEAELTMFKSEKIHVRTNVGYIYIYMQL